MSATEELRRLLDERGVEWDEVDHHTLWWGESIHHQASAYSSILFGESGRVHLSAMVTPAQAIAATLGVGTCHNESKYPQMFFYCSECGCAHKRNRAYVDMPRFCPNCGRRVVEVDG